MKFFVTIFASLFVFSAQGQEVIKSNFQTAFIPAGFDSNDRVQIVGRGSFPNGCYKSGPTNVRVDKKNKVIELRSSAYKYAADFCVSVIVYYNDIVDIGVLEPGNYTVVTADTKKNLESFLFKQRRDLMQMIFYMHLFLKLTLNLLKELADQKQKLS